MCIRSSPQKSQAFARLVHACNISFTSDDLVVILDVDTRWNSTYAMLKRLKRLRPAIVLFIANEKGALEDDDWNILEDLLKLLKPLDDITNYLSKSKFPSLSTVIPADEACLEEITKVASQIPS